MTSPYKRSPHVVSPPESAECPIGVKEVAALIAYLAGPEAGFVTGVSLTIDGGFTA
jgi:NAD(P)-dependent dehydrogenase (short-subunit alcohol dehydrogenase family)